MFNRTGASRELPRLSFDNLTTRTTSGEKSETEKEEEAMPDEVVQDPNVTVTPAEGTDGGPPLGGQPGGDPAAGAGGTGGATGSKTVVVPTSAMKRIKDEAYSQGRSSALEALAKDAGFESQTDLVSALTRLKNPGTPAGGGTNVTPPAGKPAGTQPSGADDPVDDGTGTVDVAKARDARREEGRYLRQLEKERNEKAKLSQALSSWQQKAKQTQEDLDAAKAEMHLRDIASGKGVRDRDYAIALLTREVEKMTPEQAASFDEGAFFDGLRKTHPYLFGEVVVPATTGTGTGGAPNAPNPGKVTTQNGKDGRVDVRNMNPQQYQEHLNKRGINPLAG